jgi:heme A synthase
MDRNAQDSPTGFTRYAWAVLAFNLGVVLWGALVRATGSGAGCGGHWPLCNGEVLPEFTGQATIIELVHRLASGVALLLVVGLWVWALRRYPRRSAARRWAWAALGLIIVEALVGAGLVLLRWVGDDASVGRSVSIALHLTITLALLASLALVAWRGAARQPVPPSVPPWVAWLLVAGVAVVGMSGAITALGDTLFPPQTLASGLAQDVAPSVHFLVRLRGIHPLLAGALAVGGILWADGRRRLIGPAPAKMRLTLLRGFLLMQLALGVANVILLSPVWLQIIHLLLANIVWLLLVICLAEAGQERPGGSELRGR